MECFSPYSQFHRAVYMYATKTPIILPEGCNSPFDSLFMYQKKRWTTWNFALPSCQLLFLTTIKSKLCQMLIAIQIKPLYS